MITMLREGRIKSVLTVVQEDHIDLTVIWLN